VKSFFSDETCFLVHGLRYKAYPDHISCFRKGGREAGRRVLAVHLLAKGSRVSYWGGSHQHALPTIVGSRLLFEISPSALTIAGCKCEEKEYPNGGLTIFDARVSFELKGGFALTYEFATTNEAELWPKISVPSLPELLQKKEEIEDDLKSRNFQEIRMNIVFKNPPAKGLATTI